MVHHQIIDLLEAGVRDAGHYRKLLVGVRQAPEKLEQIVKAGDAVELAAHDDGGHGDSLRIDHRQPGAHVDVGARRHRIIKRENRVGEGLDHFFLGTARVIAVENAGTKARSIGRRFMLCHCGSFLRRSSSVGLPSPVHTKASSASR